MSKDTSDPAFPWTGVGQDGMTLRDYFAAKAMPHAMVVHKIDNGLVFDHEASAKNCSAMADALLKERDK